jgi:hypothetical protein
MTYDPIKQAGDAADSEVKGVLKNLANLVKAFFGGRHVLFAYDYFSMRFTGNLRHRQLAYDEMTCRFCECDIDLMGGWMCSCHFRRWGSYFGRCPQCLRHPRYIDCPTCGGSMDVR